MEIKWNQNSPFVKPNNRTSMAVKTMYNTAWEIIQADQVKMLFDCTSVQS